MTTYSALKFDKGMTPKVFTPNSATRIEHFDTITEVLRPFRTLVASSNNQSVATTALGLIGFEILNDTIYAVGKEHTAGVCGAIYKWDTTLFEWQSEQSLTATNVASSMLQAHAGYLFGIQSSRYLYRLTVPATFSLTFYDCGTITNGFAEAITHSKDGVMYFATDNKIHKVLSDGSAGSLALTLPNANYRITSLSESGNFVEIVGFDVKSGESSRLFWDRDTSVVDLTESTGLGRDFVVHNATLLGTTFFVQVRINTTNSSFSEKPVLIIKFLNGNTPETLYEFPLASLSSTSTVNNMIGSKYVSLDRLYFTAKVQFDGEASARNICFALDYKGRLTIAQNVDVNTGTNAISGIFRDGEAFWFGAGSDGAWNTTSTYATTSSFETNDIRSDNLGLNIQLVEAYITCESLPSASTTVNAGSFVVGLPYEILTVGTTDFTLIGASANTVGVKFVATGVGSGTGTVTSKATIVIKARKNAETTFSILKIFNTTANTKLKLTGLEAVNALNGLDSARNVRFRLESTGGAVITGFQAFFNDVKDQGNG